VLTELTGNIATSLYGYPDSVQRIGMERALHTRAYPEENPKSREARRITARAHLQWQPGNVWCLPPDKHHILYGRPYIFGGDIPTLEGVNKTPHGSKKRLGLAPLRVANDNRFASTKWRVSRCSFVGHTLGEAIGIE
jgi:hypothetical protein